MMTDLVFPYGIKDDYRILVFCFHHAGGNASIFRSWMNSAVQTNIVPIENPGRGARMGEKIPEDFMQLAKEFSYSIYKAVYPQKLFCLYGHSMGALMAFQVAACLENKYHIKPYKLIVAGRTAPHKSDKGIYRTSMPDSVLIEEIRRLGGTPKDILENKEFIDIFIPGIKQEYKLLESYVYQGECLDIPIVAHVGVGDPDATENDMEYWKEVTNGTFKLSKFKGEHFFPFDEENYIQKLEADIADEFGEV